VGTRRAIITGILALGTLIIFAPTFVSMFRTWMNSATFFHCILILPISGFLIWQRRHDLARLPVRMSSTGFAALVSSVIVWHLASLIHVQVGQQFAMIAALVSGALFVFGPAVVKAIRFPLAFAVFAVPFGEALIPMLVKWTAWMTAHMLRLTGIPLLTDGNLLYVPNGTFEVAEACSGIRFLIVGVAVAILFAHQAYASLAKRIAFVLSIALAMIVANCLRAYVIVFVANATDMRYGADHNVFGWLVFLVTIGAGFWIGASIRDELHDRDTVASGEASSTVTNAHSRGLIFRLGIAFIVMVAAVGLLHLNMARLAAPVGNALLPQVSATWSGPLNPVSGYTPVFASNAPTLAGLYTDGDSTIELHIVWFAHQEQDYELVGYGNELFDRRRWRLVRDTTLVSIPVAAVGELELHFAEISNGEKSLAIWSWYDVGGTPVTGTFEAKFHQLRHTVAGSMNGDAFLAVVRPVGDIPGDIVQDSMRSFLAFAYPKISACLRPAVDLQAKCDPYGEKAGHGQ